MKKILLIFLLFFALSFTVFSASFFYSEHRHYITFIRSGEQVSADATQRTIVFAKSDKTAEQTFHDLSAVLSHFKANLYTMQYSEDGKTSTKFVYCANPEAFSSLVLEQGRFFTSDENCTDLFLSTKETNDPRQIGQLAAFRKDERYEIRSIYSGLDVGFFDKEFRLFLPDGADFADFQESMAALGYDVIDTTKGLADTFQSSLLFYSSVKWLAILVTLFLVLLIISFQIINSYRKTGIEKLMGYSLVAIWSKRMPALFLLEFFGLALPPCIAYFLLFAQQSILIRDFYLDLFQSYSFIMLLSLLVLSLPFLYIKGIKVSDILKNKRSASLAIGFNTGIKLLLSTLLVCFSFQAFNQISLIQARYSRSYESWEASKSYALIKYAVAGTREYDLYSQENMPCFLEAYKEFNQAGAIYADFSAYESLVSDDRSSFLPAYGSFAFVNPNYLSRHVAYSLGHRPITISEEEEDFVLLLPEKYKEAEKEILDWYKKNAKEGQRIRLIWLENGQSFFSYRLDIAPQTGNCIEDPIFVLVSEANMPDMVYGNIANGALFIPVENIQTPSAELNQVMANYFDSDQVSFATFSLYSLVDSQIQEARQTMIFYSVLLCILVLIFCSVIFQNVLNFFDQHQQRLAVQQLMGFMLRDKYKSLFLLSLLSAPLVYLASALMMKSWSLIWLVLAFLLFELFLLGVFILRQEGKGVLRVIKGG